MLKVVFIGRDREMEQHHYSGSRWWLFFHRWLPENGGIARVVILGRVLEIARE